MKIGIDLDGVVIDSEKLFRTYAELYDINYLNKDSLINKEAKKIQERYNWSEEEFLDFAKKYFVKISKESNIMPGFKKVYELLKPYNEFIVITARGNLIPGMIDDGKRILSENDIVFDKYYWSSVNKEDVCIEENIDIMIDDDASIIKKCADKNIKTLYFRDTGLKKLEENKFITEINNWGEAYKILRKTKNK